MSWRRGWPWLSRQVVAFCKRKSAVLLVVRHAGDECRMSMVPRAAVAVREPESADTGSNLAAALAYLGGFISGIIVLNIERYKQNPFVRFHAYQSIFLNVFGIVVMIALVSISGMLGYGFLWSLIALVKSLLGLAFFMLALLFMMYKAFKGERLSLPFVGPLAATRAG